VPLSDGAPPLPASPAVPRGGDADAVLCEGAVARSSAALRGAAPRRRGAEAGCAQRAVEQGSSGRPRGGVAWRIAEQCSGGGEQWPAARSTQRSGGWEQPRTLQFCCSSHYQPACKMFGRMPHKILGAKVQAEMV